jgi:putative endonuclease
MKKGNISFGKKGEDLAAKYLEDQGFHILERNWRYKHVEIDIIASYYEFLVIVEVKTKNRIDYGEPYLKVNYRKQRCLIFAAERYLFSHHIDKEVRFDIISIIIKNEQTAIEHIPDAFRAIAR